MPRGHLSGSDDGTGVVCRLVLGRVCWLLKNLTNAPGAFVSTWLEYWEVAVLAGKRSIRGLTAHEARARSWPLEQREAFYQLTDSPSVKSAAQPRGKVASNTLIRTLRARMTSSDDLAGLRGEGKGTADLPFCARRGETERRALCLLMRGEGTQGETRGDRGRALCLPLSPL